MTVRLAMAFKEIDMADLEPLFDDPNIAVEQKVDGTRALCVVEEKDDVTVFRFLTRGGKVLAHTAATQHLDKIKQALLDGMLPGGADFEVVLDGEVMIDTGEYIVFDLPYVRTASGEKVTPETPYWQRRQVLSGVLSGVDRPVRLGGMATTPDDKRDLLRRVQESGGEGVMAKKLDSVYEPGKRVRSCVKVKFVKTADVIVTGSTRGRNAAGREVGSFEFAVVGDEPTIKERMEPGILTIDLDEGVRRLIPMGTCSAIGKPETKVGDVIEVAYLYRPKSGGLVQPRMMRVREDKTPDQCRMDQFVDYSKAVV